MLPIHSLAQQTNLPAFEIQCWKKQVARKEKPIPHRHSYHELLFLLKGKGAHEIDFTHYSLTPGTVHAVPAYSIHVVRREVGSEGLSILFTEDFLPTDVQLSHYPFFGHRPQPVIHINAAERQQLQQLLHILQIEYTNKAAHQFELLQHYFMALLTLLKRAQPAASTKAAREKAQHPTLQLFEKLLDMHFRHHWRAANYAATAGVTVERLNALCKKYYGTTTQQTIHQRLILEIKRQLAYTSTSVKSICYDLGFEDPAYFNRFFKSYVQLTPQQYRNALDE